MRLDGRMCTSTLQDEHTQSADKYATRCATALKALQDEQTQVSKSKRGKIQNQDSQRQSDQPEMCGKAPAHLQMRPYAHLQNSRKMAAKHISRSTSQILNTMNRRAKVTSVTRTNWHPLRDVSTTLPHGAGSQIPTHSRCARQWLTLHSKIQLHCARRCTALDCASPNTLRLCEPKLLCERPVVLATP